MIRNFTDRDTEQLFRTERTRRFNAIAPQELSRLPAVASGEGWVPPGNRLETLKGNLAGFPLVRTSARPRS